MESDDNARNESQNIDDVNPAPSTLPQVLTEERKLPENFGQILHMPIEQTQNEINIDSDGSFYGFPLDQMMMTECLKNSNSNIVHTNICSEDAGNDLEIRVDGNHQDTENNLHNISESSSTPINVTDL